MRVSVKELEGGSKAFSYQYTPDDFSLGEEHVRLKSPLQVAVTASLKGKELRLKGSVTGQVEASCDRCLRPLPVEVEQSFDAHYIPTADYHESQTAELQDADMNFSVFDGETIDLDELIREQVLLSLPVRLLCREECEGLCPRCGADLNEGACACQEQTRDPRWDALAAWKKSE